MVALAALGAALLAVAAPEPRALDARRFAFAPRRRLAAIGGGAATGLALALAVTTPPLRPPPGTVWMVALDVGQGDALALGFHDGWWLVDAGPAAPAYDAGRRVVLPFLRWAGVRRVGRLVLTHDDLDHTGGADAIREGVRVRRTLAPAALPHRAGPARRFAAREAAAGDTLRTGPLVTVLWPPRGADVRQDNQASLVLMVGEGAGRALLAADADTVVERRLPPAAVRDLAVLKVGHHGSRTSSGADFLAVARPRVALISCGRNDRFGHPHGEVMSRLAAAGAEVRRTDREGTVWLSLTAAGARPLDWRRGEPERAARAREPVAPPRPRW